MNPEASYQPCAIRVTHSPDHNGSCRTLADSAQYPRAHDRPSRTGRTVLENSQG
jgi:hypothetical protein